MNSRLLIIVFILVMSLTGIAVITWSQHQRLDKLNDEKKHNEMQKLLEAVSIAGRPESIATAKFHEIVDKNRSLAAADLPGIKDLLLKEFGSEIKFVISDAQLKNFCINGFNKHEADEMKEVLKLFKDHNSGDKLSVPAHIHEKLKTIMAESFDLIHVPNFLTTYQGQLNNESGTIIFGFLMNPVMRKHSSARQSRAADGEHFQNNLRSAMIVLIPEKIYTAKIWFQNNLNKIIADEDISYFSGTSDELIADLEKTDHSAATTLRSMTGKATRGAFSSRNARYFYNDTGIRHDNQTLYLLAKKPAGHLTGKVAYAIATVILLLFFLIMITFVNNNARQTLIKLSLMQHFLILTFLSSSIPIVALSIQGISKTYSSSLQHEEIIYHRLEEKLKKIDKEYNIEIGDMLTAIKIFQLFCDEMPEYSYDLIAKHAAKLFRYRLSQIYTSDQSGNVNVFDIKQVGHSDNEMPREATRFLTILVKFIQQSLKIGQISQEMAVKDGMIIEAATEALGTENLYLLAINYNQLLAFKMLHGAVWTLTLTQKDPGGALKYFFLYIVHRSRFQLLLIDRWQQRFSKGFPDYAFANQHVSYLTKIAPIWAEQRPAIISMLNELNKNGGVIKTSFKDGNKTLFCLGRRIRNLDWACMAFEVAEYKTGNTDQTTFIIVLIILYVISAVIAVAIYFNSIFIKPVVSLGSGVNAMAEGRYDLQIKIDSDDEIGQMCQSFNNMARSLKEKEFLNRFLSDIARDAITGKASNRATRIEGTILFSDIRNFTTMTEQNQPEIIVEMLNDYMTTMEECIESESGSIEKFIGDAIMAVFLPAHGLAHSAVRATKAAEKMMDALKKLNQKRKNSGQFAITIGAGIATGNLLMGIMGNEQGRRDYTVTGITVRSAATMEKHTSLATHRKIVLCPHSAGIVLSSGIKTSKLKNVEAYELK